MSVASRRLRAESPSLGATIGYQIGLIGFVRFGCLLRQMRYIRFVHLSLVHRLLLILATSICFLPLRWWQTSRFGPQIVRVKLDHPPIFIIGHWRSGTTHLHNLMSQDPALGWVSMYQAVVPDFSLAGQSWLKPLLTRIVPADRPMDNVPWSMDRPQEDEIALAKMTPYSFHAQFLFPHLTTVSFDRYVLLDDASPTMVAELERTYQRLLKIATLHAGGKQLLLKNPVNTARLRLLVPLFPDAKFIHIHRSPYDVYPSAVHSFRQLLQILSLQNLQCLDLGEIVLQIYEKIMRRFLADKPLIPPGNLVELRYEDLERNAETDVKRIYDTLSLPGYEGLAPALRAYNASVGSYQKNKFKLTAAERQLVGDRLAFAFDALGHERTQGAVTIQGA
jgi:hypothetical protein